MNESNLHKCIAQLELISNPRFNKVELSRTYGQWRVCIDNLYDNGNVEISKESLEDAIEEAVLQYSKFTNNRTEQDLLPVNAKEQTVEGEVEIFTKIRNQVTPANRIECIKKLRSAIPGLGLADAKYATEHDLKNVITFIRKNGTLVGYGIRGK